MYQFFKRLSKSFRKTPHAAAVNSQDWSRSHHSGSTQISEPNIHNTTLTKMIADSTFVTIHEVLKSLHDLEVSSSLDMMDDITSTAYIRNPNSCNWRPRAGQIEMGDIKGGLGGTGGSARMGGEGGEGEGPKLDMSPNERWKIGNVSGGTGGTGGIGIEVGGKGGSGKAPVISMLRTNPVIVPPERE
ncbi:hypothetical protein DFH09DRAFT_1092782 [Mycena vulgaris]|nr:hypothetical protein DFH09DRAFT_1092782 [Mycena vulgaris]